MKFFFRLGFACFFCFVCTSLYAQFKITGTVSDSTNKENISGASVSLVNATNNVTKTVVTTNDGFIFADVSKGAYILKIEHINFKSSSLNIIIDRDLSLAMKLARYISGLSNVNVTSTRRMIEQTDDKLIYNVENDLTAKTENALDLLRKTPMVSVDGNGGIQLNGQTNFKILLNGRETAMFATNVSEALRSFSGSSISKIEVVTNPSAKYDAEGVGGLINIITRKKVAGFNGSIGARYNTNGTANFFSNFSLKTNKTTLAINYGGFKSFNQRNDGSLELMPLTPSIYSHRFTTGQGRINNFFHFGNAELNYDIDSLSTLVAYGNVSGGTSKVFRDNTMLTEFSNGNNQQASFSTNNRNQSPSSNIGSDYIRRGKKHKENEFSLRLYADFNRNNLENNSNQVFPSYNRYIKNESLAFSRQITIQSDYSITLGKTRRLELGAKKVIRYARSDFNVLLKYDLNSSYKTDPNSTDIFEYNQSVDGAYASYQFKISKLQFRVGGRFEHTEINGDFVTSKKQVLQDYNSFLPNAQVSFKIIPSWTMVLNYNKRLERPFIQSLNPYVNRTDTLNIAFGNPDLGPQNLHVYSMQNKLLLGSSFLGFGIFFQQSNDKITSYNSFNQTTGISSTTILNVGKESQLSFNVNYSNKFNNKWSTSINLSPRYIQISNGLNSSESNSGWAGAISTNVTYIAGKKISYTAYAGGSRPAVFIQSIPAGNYYYAIAAAIKLAKDKLLLNLVAQNFHKERFRYVNTTHTAALVSEVITENPWRLFGIGLTYNFGKITQVVSRKKGVSNDDAISN
jgi:outer membrane cobalamin receptor